MTKPVLIVGAGFSGAVHARLLAEAGYHIDVIDVRPHIGGNAYDHVDANGIRVHAYGPHLFHTKNRQVAAWLRGFGDFVDYTHKVRALLPSGDLAPLPINLDTVNLVFGTAYTTAEQVATHLARVAVPNPAPANAAEYLYAQIGRELTDLFFRPYTKKMWQFDLEDMASSVVKRIPLRTDRTDTYFADDELQMMPREGYTAVFARLFDHPGISVTLQTGFDHSMLGDYSFCFNAMPIDAYFDYAEGELPYRSIRFHTRTITDAPPQDWSVTNYTDTGNLTRETRWDCLPHHIVTETGRRTITAEEPCDYRDNNRERYYPVKTADNRFQGIYAKYQKLSDELSSKLAFIGRCGTYQYLDMDQVINQSLASARRWLASRS
ncbi:UDP-galactopyranose mutase [Acidiphilium sp.]|uniref:UDP-galactopyranose mutase n=1 Tax=Acidiphilium sp. TaxID=527 RepID=UPI003D086734